MKKSQHNEITEITEYNKETLFQLIYKGFHKQSLFRANFNNRLVITSFVYINS